MKNTLLTCFLKKLRREEKEPEPRPMTNGDKMRAMSDEELAVWCRDAVSCAVCPMLSACNGNITTCTSRWYGYLKAAADV